MEKAISFEDFCADPQLLGEPVSKAWAVFYRAVEGLPLDEEGVEIFRRATGRERYEPRVCTEATGLCGRRSEKTQTVVKFLIWKALTAGWERQLRGSWLRKRLLRVPLIAQDLRVARDIKRAAEALVTASPILSREVAEVRVSEVIFRNGISLICLPASKASVRGLTCPAALLDELAWVSIDGADDKELVRQVRPALIQFGEARRLIKLSTPWQKAGILFDEFSRRFERDDLLVWQASTAAMTPRIPAEYLERERAADAAYFLREYEAQFTDDLESFLPARDVDAALADWGEQAPREGPAYLAALDASGLTGGDRFTFGIAHAEETGGAVDVLRGWRRAPVAQVCDEIAALCRAYRAPEVIADQYSFAFVRELLARREVRLEQLAFSARSKPEVFFALRNALAQGRLRLPNHAEAARELRVLESARTSGGSYRIAAPRGAHDDYATVLALLAHRLAEPQIEPQIYAMRRDEDDWFRPPRRASFAR